jgi:DivIVA domain-containing protein
VTGDEVRNVKFSSGGMYDVPQVNDLLERIAAELDAGRPARPLIENAAFQKRIFRRGYDTGAVDWFLEQLRRRETPSEVACRNADPWRDLDAEPYCIYREPDGSAGRIAAPSPQECADAWRDFGQQPGTPLSWVRTGAWSRELRTADQQPIASFRYGAAFRQGFPSFYGNHSLSVGRRTFTLKKVTRSAWPGIAETISRDQPSAPAHFPRGQTGDRDPSLRQLLDETGIPVLYRGGQHFDHSAGSYIKFPGQRWLRFPIRCTARSNAIMTAVDQAGNKVARYRFAGSRKTMEIAIHPDQRLTEELILAIAVSAPWVADYFRRPSGGG